MTKPYLKIEAVDKFYGAIGVGVHAVQNVSIEINKGEIVALLGSSGCGKTSTLRMIAGFEETSRGTISLGGRIIHTLPPVQRKVAMAFEGYSLYPTVNVRDNIAFALKAKKLPTDEVNKRVREISDMLEITDILDRYPTSISGGQQQRASLARALIRDADLHLLDEPMGQLEPQLRTLLRGRIKNFIKQRGLTAILVTHDQTEANALADRIAVMEGGILQQFATPDEIKDSPANLFTGTFVGEPPMNVFNAKISISNNSIEFELDGGEKLSYPTNKFSKEVHDKLKSYENVVLGVRPYAIHRDNKGNEALVIANQWLGDQSHICVTIDQSSAVLVEHDRANVKVGDTIKISFSPDDLHVFDANDGSAISHGAKLTS